MKKKIETALAKSLSKTIGTDELTKYLHKTLKEYVLAGGKRLRPLLLVKTYHSLGGRNEAIFNIASAIELYHNYSLIIDDIIDEDALRREMPSLHARFEHYLKKHEFFRENNRTIYSSNLNRLSVSYGILLGNVANILSKETILSATFPMKLKYQALNIMNQVDLKLHKGQILDIFYELKVPSKEEYYNMIYLKTSALFYLTMKLGALFAGNTKFDDKYDKLSEALGKGYQLQNDLQAVYDHEQGKISSDLLNRKKNLLMIKALDNANKEQKKILETGTNDNIISLYYELGSIAYCKKRINENRKLVLEHLKKLKLSDFTEIKEIIFRENNV